MLVVGLATGLYMSDGNNDHMLIHGLHRHLRGVQCRWHSYLRRQQVARRGRGYDRDRLRPLGR